MRGIAFAVFCAFLMVLGLPAAPARAGGYGVVAHGPRYVWYSSNCCYRRVVRHEREVFYVRAGTYVPDEVVVEPRPRAYDRRAVYVEPMVRHRQVRFSEFDVYWNDREFGVTGCYWNEAPVPIAPGAWAWGRKTTCY
jgi:hypothetical protein